MTFLDIGFIDFLDILLVSFIFYQVYILIRGTVAMNIFVGVFSLYMLWFMVRALNMQLLSSILGQIMGVGVIAILIVFQQEIRRFFLIIGTRYLSNANFAIENIFSFIIKPEPEIALDDILDACQKLSITKTGALIVISNQSSLDSYTETGEILDAKTSSELIQNIFFKNAPLHDGAAIIKSEKIIAARCVLPVSENPRISPNLGLRHRSAIGISENTDAFTLVVSEETGKISLSYHSKLIENKSIDELRIILQKGLIDKQKEPFNLKTMLAEIKKSIIEEDSSKNISE